MAVEINKKRVVIIAAFAANTYLSNIITNIESDSENEEFVQECINMEENIRVRGKVRKTNRIEGFIENIILRLNRKQFVTMQPECIVTSLPTPSVQFAPSIRAAV